MKTAVEQVFMECGQLLPELLSEKLPSFERQREVLGSVWEHCWMALEADPTLPDWAADTGRLRKELERLVEEALRLNASKHVETNQVRSGALGVFFDAQLHPIGNQDAEEADEPCRELGWECPSGLPNEADSRPLSAVPVLADAIAEAQSRGSQTMLRNLRWMELRDEGRSYDSIAEECETKCKTVRSGVHRARRFTRQVAVEKKRADNAPNQGHCLAALEPARDAWRNGDLETMRRALDAVCDEYGQHAYFCYLSALLADDEGDRESAITLFESILRDDDDRGLRAKVLNCLGYIADDRGDLESARRLWTRAVQVDPTHTPPHVNLLKNACDRRDRLDLLAELDVVSGLLTARSLVTEDKQYLLTRLRDHPDLAWARGLDAWSKGPARWIARQEESNELAPPVVTAARNSQDEAKLLERVPLWLGGISTVLLALGLGFHWPVQATVEERASETLIEKHIGTSRLVSGDRGAFSPDCRLAGEGSVDPMLCGGPAA